jgi:hypothetical protein
MLMIQPGMLLDTVLGLNKLTNKTDAWPIFGRDKTPLIDEIIAQSHAIGEAILTHDLMTIVSRINRWVCNHRTYFGC